MSATREKMLPVSRNPTIPSPPARDRRAELGVEDQEAVAADRQQVGVERIARLRGHVSRADAVEGKAADRRVAPGIEALALRQVVNDLQLAVCPRGFARKS